MLNNPHLLLFTGSKPEYERVETIVERLPEMFCIFCKIKYTDYYRENQKTAVQCLLMAGMAD